MEILTIFISSMKFMLHQTVKLSMDSVGNEKIRNVFVLVTKVQCVGNRHTQICLVENMQCKVAFLKCYL